MATLIIGVRHSTETDCDPLVASMALFRSGPATRDLRGFLELLDQRGQLKRITAPVEPDLELAAIADRVLAQGGPALLFENVIGSSMPVAVNTLGTVERVVWSMGLERAEQLEELGSRLALLQQPRPPKGLSETKQFARVFWDLVKACLLYTSPSPRDLH